MKKSANIENKHENDILCIKKIEKTTSFSHFSSSFSYLEGRRHKGIYSGGTCTYRQTDKLIQRKAEKGRLHK